MAPSEIGGIIPVKSEKVSTYNVYIKRGCIDEIPSAIADLGSAKHVLIVTDDYADKLFAAGLATSTAHAGFTVLKFVLEPRRIKKTLDTAQDVFRILFNAGADRNTVVLNVGGGTVGDIGGFVAALYLRGIRYIHIPTTIISQIDSSIGGKVHVNFDTHLNGLSVFHHPAAVYTDPTVLDSLPIREYRSGLAEIVKYATIMDSRLFADLERTCMQIAIPKNNVLESMLLRCIEAKCQIVSTDPQGQGLYRLFSFGHELGHAIEVAYDYEHLLHGEGVSIGILASTWMAIKAGLCHPSLYPRLRNLLLSLNLPTAIPETLRNHFPPQVLENRLKQLLSHNARRPGEGIAWILPHDVGNGVCTKELPHHVVERCLHLIATGGMDAD